MSNRKKIRHPLAHLDGLRIPDSCCRTELVVSRRGSDVFAADFAHDPWCDHRDPMVRLRASSAAIRELDRRGIRAVQVITTTGETGLWILPAKETSP